MLSYRRLQDGNTELVRGEGEPTETVLGELTTRHQIGPRGGKRTCYQFTWADTWAGHVSERVVVHRTMRGLKAHVQTAARALDQEPDGTGGKQ